MGENLRRSGAIKKKKRPHLSQLRVTAPLKQRKEVPYTFSSCGSFTEGDIHIGKNGMSIESSPKSPQVQDTITKDQIIIFDDKILGQGAGGLVKQARFIPKDCIVAVKKVPLNLEPGIRKKVLMELRTLYQCDHPNIVAFYGGYLQNAGINMVLEYMNAGTLLDCLKVRGRFPEFIVGKIAALLLPALSYIHKQLHIVHRDIKPSNILLTATGEVKMSDFGVSGKLVNTIGVATTFAGTLTYMSPERIQGGEHSTTSDVWSFGLSLLECSLGHFPFISLEEDKSSITFFDLLHRIQNDPLLLPDDFSPDFRSFIELCLMKNPNERPSATALIEHAWVRKYSEETSMHICRWIHQTLRMQNKPFDCSPDLCGDCMGSYIATKEQNPNNFYDEPTSPSPK